LLVSDQDTNKLVREKALKRLEELCLKSIESLRDIPELEQPTDEENQFIKRKIFRNDKEQ
jgi:hypothetical protein